MHFEPPTHAPSPAFPTWCESLLASILAATKALLGPAWPCLGWQFGEFPPNTAYSQYSVLAITPRPPSSVLQRIRPPLIYLGGCSRRGRPVEAAGPCASRACRAIPAPVRLDMAANGTARRWPGRAADGPVTVAGEGGASSLASPTAPTGPTGRETISKQCTTRSTPATPVRTTPKSSGTTK